MGDDREILRLVRALGPDALRDAARSLSHREYSPAPKQFMSLARLLEGPAAQSTGREWRDRFVAFVDHPPPGWKPRREAMAIGYDLIPPFVDASGLCVCLSVDATASGLWLHLSVSMRDRLPRWPEVVRARDAFLGPNVACVHAVPDSRDHRNHHPYVLHLWAREDGEPVIDPMLGEYVAPRSAHG